jgi:hypothetical protein
MANRTLTVTSVGEAPKTLTINRDRFAGVRTMTRVEAGGETTVITVNRTASGVRTGEKSGQSRPLLNKVIGGAAAAYSLRDLNDKANTTKVVRVRRGSDNAELDFTAKDINTSVVENWVGAGNDGFVSIWYDQSGNGKDITQITATRQPKIVDQGTLIKNTDGQVSTSFNKATADELAASGLIALPCYTFVYCEDLAGASATHRPLFGGYSGRGLGIMQGGGIRLYHGSSLNMILPTVTGPKVITALSKPVGAAVYENGILRAFGDAGTLALPYVVGGAFGWDGDLAPDLLVSEVIIFNGDQSANRLAIEANMNNQYGISQSSIPPTQFGSRLLFHGATSVLKGANYQIGQLIHRVTIDSSGNSTVSVNKTDQSTDVDISSFNYLGTVSSNRASSFVIRAIGNRNGVNSAIQGAITDDSIGVVGQGNPSKIDVNDGNETEFITFEVVNLNPALTISIKTVYCIQANFMGTTVPLDRPLMVLTPFAPLDPLNPKISVAINVKGHAIKAIPVNSSQMDLVGTGTGINGIFKIGVSSLQGLNVGYGLYAIDFDVTG